MKRVRPYIPIVALLLMLSSGISSCRRDTAVRDALTRAEALMETDPHAARAILDSIASPNPPLKGRASESTGIPSFRRGKGEAALYALLRTQADYKCRVRLTSDSLPLIATNYYGTRRKTQHAALAQYYLGCAYKDMHRDLDAIDALLRATTLFPDTTNKYFAYSLFELGKLYMNHQMNDEAISTFGRYRFSEICKADSLNIGYADFYMGVSYLYKGENNLADSLFHLAIHNTQLPTSSRFNTYFQLAKLYFYEWHKADESYDFINRYISYYGENEVAVLLKGDILSAVHQPNSAEEFYNKTLQQSTDLYARCTAYKGLLKVTSQLNKTDSIQSYVDQYTQLLDSIYAINRQEEIAEIQNSHVIELHDQQLKARHARFLLWGGLFFVMVFSAFSITLLLNDRKRKNERLRFEQELRDIKQRHIDQSIKEETEADSDEWEESNEDDFDEGQKNNVTEVKESIPVSNHLSIQQERIALYRKEFADSRWKRFLEERKLDVLSKKFMPMDEAEEFKEYLENLFADVFLDMVNDNANVTRQDIEYCAMTMLGFSTAQISYCARVSLHSLHNRRYHIKDKLTSDWYTLVFGSPK